MKITRGLDVPISGEPTQKIESLIMPENVALLGQDYPELRPVMKVVEGDKVKRGQVLFVDRKNPDVQFTSPGGGVVAGVNRGARRVLNSVVIELDDDEQSEQFIAPTPNAAESLDVDNIRQVLQQSGVWTAFRTRPYSKVPQADSAPAAIFVNAMDTRPLAADPTVIINEDSGAFLAGVAIIARLAPKVYVCHATGADMPRSDVDTVSYHHFEGVHPAGLPGTHIHFLEPVSDSKTVWYINYQDVMAVAGLFATGTLPVERVVALTGPMVKEPRLVRTRLGASTDELVQGQLNDTEPCRVISGSVLSGHRAAGTSAYLGRFSLQVSVIAEGQPRVFLHWLNPLLKQFSAINVFLRPGLRKATFAMSSTQNGSHRAMVPIGNYEQVVPLDILPTQLLRALLVRDTVVAQELGALELDEEDLALCTFVCHSKYDYAPALRECLSMIERGE